MEFAIEMGITGWAVLLVGAFLFGVIAQFVGETRTGYEWLIDAVAAAIGALITSEFLTGWRGVDPVVDGLAILPALAGGLVLGVIADMVTRYATGGRYMGHPMAA